MGPHTTPPVQLVEELGRPAVATTPRGTCRIQGCTAPATCELAIRGRWESTQKPAHLTLAYCTPHALDVMDAIMEALEAERDQAVS